MFKVGDKVKFMNVECTIVGILGDKFLWLGCEVPFTAAFGDVTPIDTPITPIDTPPTPPEGREVEGERRLPINGDEYLDEQTEWWMNADNDWEELKSIPDKYNWKRWCLRPLPPKPEGDGWEWRRPVNGDEVQSLDVGGNPAGGIYKSDEADVFMPVRLGYRWCRKQLPTLGQVAKDAFFGDDDWSSPGGANWEAIAAAVVHEYQARRKSEANL